MSRRKVIFVAAIAAVGLVFLSHSASAQHGGMSYGSSAFDYPAGPGCTDCTSGGIASWGAQNRAYGATHMSQRWKASQAHNDKVSARNEAWPRPFACASRQHYHNIWISMYDAGWEEQCILTATHFDENGELTRYGKQQIGGMMMNMPKSRRVIFVQETANPAETATRVAKVRNVIETWYGQRGGIVQISSRTPQTQSGDKTVDIFDKAKGAAPPPVIPISDGSQGVANSINQ